MMFDPTPFTGNVSVMPLTRQIQSDTSRALPPTASLNWIVGAVWFGLAAASVHVLDVLWIRYGRGEITWTGREFFWMASLSYVLLFVACALPIAVLALIVPPLRRPRLMVASLGWLLLFSTLLILAPRLHSLASALLACGAAIRLSGFHMLRNVRYSIPVIVAASPALLAGLFGAAEQLTRDRREARALARHPRTEAGNHDVLLVVLDAVRARNLSAYGYSRSTTPTLERVAREGVLFERAFATSSWTLPSHASMFTGLLPGEMRLDWKIPFSENTPTLAERLASAGFATGSFAANFFYMTYDAGLGRGFVHLDDYDLSTRQIIRSNILAQTVGGYLLSEAPSLRSFLTFLARPNLTRVGWPNHAKRNASEMIDRFLQWQARLNERPYFAVLNLFDAHEPYTSADSTRVRFLEGAQSRDIGAYDAAIAEMDQQLGRLVDSLSLRQRLDKTLLIITSDHGEAFGEHGVTSHGNSLYLNELWVPLIIRFPGRVPVNRRISEVVSLRALTPTILHQVAAPGADTMRNSLSRFWGSDGGRHVDSAIAFAQISQLVQGGRGPVREGPINALITERWHYIEGPGRNRELYEYMLDIGEDRNLIADLSYRDTADALARRLQLALPGFAPRRSDSVTGN